LIRSIRAGVTAHLAPHVGDEVDADRLQITVGVDYVGARRLA
jgi:hypothetical protein